MEKDYICGCGKAYGSYPAFSTHRKTKHQNITVEGTVMPTQQKAKRGRPSCDFKKVPEIDDNKKEYYQGLNIIQYGLLDLQQKYKGKILSQPHQNNESIIKDIESDRSDDQKLIQAICMFIKLLTTHMKVQCSQITSYFFADMIKFGIANSQLNSIQLYNNFCLANIKKLANSVMGINYYIDICLLLSKWLCVMGFSKEILRVKSKSSQIPQKSEYIVS